MPGPSASCPSCGALIAFRWSGAVQTTCDFCKSVLVRHDVDLTKVGTVSDLPATASPIQLGTEGRFKNATFVVVGRITYEYERGAWSEWHLVFNDGRSGWLSDAQLEYAITFLKDVDGTTLPRPDAVQPGKAVRLGGTEYVAATLTRASYRGVEGDLPFEYWDKREVPFLDLRSYDGGFATIDYSDEPPLLFTGEAVAFGELGLRNVREFEGWALPSPGTRAAAGA